MESQVAGVVIFNDDKVLVVKHTEKAGHITGHYGLPAGRCESGESYEATAVRELFEETGIHASISDLIPLPTIFHEIIPRKDGKKEFIMRVFLCRKYSGKLRNSEETIPEWMPLRSLDSHPFIGSAKHAIREAFQLSKSL